MSVNKNMIVDTKEDTKKVRTPLLVIISKQDRIALFFMLLILNYSKNYSRTDIII